MANTPSNSDDEAIVRGLAVGAVYGSDLERSRAFYEGLLGMQFLCEMSPGVLLSVGESQVYLEGGREPADSPRMTGVGTSLCLDCASVRTAERRLRAADVEFVEDYRELGSDFAMFRVLDPDGNVVELVGKP
jgi:catechol 2,3-dioxygenase-like lactoylglutathione lyase family enzyme